MLGSFQGTKTALSQSSNSKRKLQLSLVRREAGSMAPSKVEWLQIDDKMFLFLGSESVNCQISALFVSTVYLFLCFFCYFWRLTSLYVKGNPPVTSWQRFQQTSQSKWHILSWCSGTWVDKRVPPWLTRQGSKFPSWTIKSSVINRAVVKIQTCSFPGSMTSRRKKETSHGKGI